MKTQQEVEKLKVELQIKIMDIESKWFDCSEQEHMKLAEQRSRLVAQVHILMEVLE